MRDDRPRGQTEETDMTSDLLFLLRNTTPVPGERAAAVESWRNVLVAAGMSRHDAAVEIDAASRAWDRTARAKGAGR